jgi:hypothetical protein
MRADLVEISRAVILTAQQTLEEIENAALEEVYKHMEANDITKKLRDILEFFNFKRDFTQVPGQFIEMFRQNFEADEALIDEYTLRCLVQRYTVTKYIQGVPAGKILFFLPLFQGLGLRRKGARFSDHRLCRLVEHLQMALHGHMLQRSETLHKVLTDAAGRNRSFSLDHWMQLGERTDLLNNLYDPTEWQMALKRLDPDGNIDRMVDAIGRLQMKDIG